jgi:tetratricopeptide (TPR) repeat protein
MIVRDEAAVIERCLASALPLIDCWTICDTGSRDATPQLVEKLLGGLPGALHHSEWRDFGSNRSELMRLARGSADYLLLLDADMTVERAGQLPALEADAYLLRHLGDLDYAVPRLVSGEVDWRFVGATHEYLAAEREISQRPLQQLTIEHHADGGARADKLERDRRLLERELAEDPDNLRSLFYLAQTHRDSAQAHSDSGELERAIELYEERAAGGGWAEEAFYAAFQAGVLSGERAPERAIGLLQRAHELRPARAEPLCELARICRVLERHELAYAYAQQGLALPYPDDLLFVHRDVYEWRLLFELSIAAYWVGRPGEALEVSARLLAGGRMPAGIERTVIANREHSLRALRTPASVRAPFASLDELAGAVEWGAVTLDIDPTWPCCNPSIAADPAGGFRMIVRTVNYLIDGGRYTILDGGEQVRTLNYVAKLDDGLALTGLDALSDRSDGPPRHPGYVLGYEDCRLFNVAGRWHALATVCDRHPDGLCEIALLSLDDSEIERVSLLEGTRGRNEKNWAPFVAEQAISPFAAERHACVRILYTAAPTIVLSCDLEQGTVARLSERPTPGWAIGLRGGSQGVPVPGGNLFVLHEVLPGAALGRRYLHRFALVDGDGRLQALSPRFTLLGAELEFCAGLARRGGELLLSFGVWDRAAHLAVVDLERTLRLLEAVA